MTASIATGGKKPSMASWEGQPRVTTFRSTVGRGYSIFGISASGQTAMSRSPHFLAGNQNFRQGTDFSLIRQRAGAGSGRAPRVSGAKAAQEVLGPQTLPESFQTKAGEFRAATTKLGNTEQRT